MTVGLEIMTGKQFVWSYVIKLITCALRCRIPDDRKDVLRTNADVKLARLSWPSSGFCS